MRFSLWMVFFSFTIACPAMRGSNEAQIGGLKATLDESG